MARTSPALYTACALVLVVSGCGIPDAQLDANVIVAHAPFETENIATCSTHGSDDIQWDNQGSQGRFYHVDIGCSANLILRLPAERYEEDTPPIGQPTSWAVRVAAGPFPGSDRCAQIYREPPLLKIAGGELLLHEKGTDGFGGRNRTYTGQVTFADDFDCVSGQIDFEIRTRD